MRKLIINLLIILIWLLFGVGYFALFVANRPTPKESTSLVRWDKKEIGQAGTRIAPLAVGNKITERLIGWTDGFTMGILILPNSLMEPNGLSRYAFDL